MKKRTFLKITTVCVIVTAMVLGVFGIYADTDRAIASKDGLSVELITEKDTYSAAEDVTVGLKVTNGAAVAYRLAVAVKGFAYSSTTAPTDTYDLSAGQSVNWSWIKAGGTTPPQTEPPVTETPPTGDHLTAIAVVALVSLIGFVCLSGLKKRSKATLAMLLLVCMVMPAMAPLTASAAESDSSGTAITVVKTVTIGNQKSDIAVTVAYDCLHSNANEDQFCDHCAVVLNEGHSVRYEMENAVADTTTVGGGAIFDQVIDFCSGTGHLIWLGDHEGTELYIPFNAPATGNYTLTTRFTKAFDFAIFDLYVDDTKVLSDYDSFNDGLVGTDPVDLGTMDLAVGRHTLKVVIKGKNEASAGYIVCLDYLQLDYTVTNKQEGFLRYEMENLVPSSVNQGGGNYFHEDYYTYSGGADLLWFGEQVGATLTTSFNVPYTGHYTLTTALKKAGDFAIINLYVDGAKVLSNYDLYNSYILGTGAIRLGEFDFTAGTHTFQIEIVGKNDASVGYLAAVDYLDLQYTTTEKVEHYEVEDYVPTATLVSGDNLFVQDKDSLYGNKKAACLIGGQGASFEFKVNVAESGTYQVRSAMCAAVDLAKVQIYIDGVALSQTADCYSPILRMADLFMLGDVSLEAGTHTIRVEAIDKNESSTGYYVAIDYIDLVKH